MKKILVRKKANSKKNKQIEWPEVKEDNGNSKPAPYFKEQQSSTIQSRSIIFSTTLFFVLISLNFTLYGQTGYTVVANVIAGAPGNRDLSQYVLKSVMGNLTLRGISKTSIAVYGTVERLTPTPFKIGIDSGRYSMPDFTITNTAPVLLNNQMKMEAFGNFNINNFTVQSGSIDLNSLRDPNNSSNIILPDGTYRICLRVKEMNEQDITDFSSMCGQFTIDCRPVNGTRLITAVAKPPIKPRIAETISAGGFSLNVQFTNTTLGCNTPIKIIGKLERLSPSPFIITVSPSYIPSQVLSFGSSQNQIFPDQQLDAFANFDESRLVVSGIDPAALRDPNNPAQIKLPDGIYRMCFQAYYVNSNGSLGMPASDPNLGCVNFTLCNSGGSAPQFTQPVNNLNINSLLPVVRPTTPVVFTWTPPQSVCGSPPGGYRYDFEIREIFQNQTVTDAINNPFVFQKLALPATTFILDTNLYRNVLQEGKRYAIRVRAISANLQDSFSVENNGYSRIEAFQYGTATERLVHTPIPIKPPQFYYIPFGERKTNNWDEVYEAYTNGRGRDTSVPIREYIALNLIQNGIAYNPDAIELFMAMNPELAGLQEVRLSNKARLPNFPSVFEAERRTFETQHTVNLSPDAQASNRFKQLVDSINTGNSVQRLQDSTALLMASLATELNAYSTTVQQVNRVTVNLLNKLLLELVSELRISDVKSRSNNVQVRTIAANLRELMANKPNTTSFLFPAYRGHTSLSAVAYSIGLQNFAVEGPLLPVDVIVWKGANEPPARPITSAPELRKSYRVFYTTTALYNGKNPEVNATVLPALATTAQASVPKMGHFKFWTVNMKNHNKTRAVDVETNDIFIINNKRKWPGSKRLYVVLKVE